MNPPHRRIGIVALLVLLTSALGLVAQPATPGPRDALLAGVKTIAAPGIPGPLAVYDPAFVVVAGKLDKQPAAVVAAAEFGKGRIVAFGHTGYFDKDTLAKAETGKLLTNACAWAAGKTTKPRIGVMGAPGLAAYLREHGFTVVEFGEKDLARAAGQAQVFAVPSHGISDTAIQTLRRLVSGGKGLITTGLAWGWQQGHPAASISEEHPGNKLLTGTGLAYADGYLSTTTNGGYKVEPVSPLLNATAAWQALIEQKEGKRKLTKAEVQQATSAVGLALRFVPFGQNPILKDVVAYGEKSPSTGLVSAAKPIRLEHGVERALLTARLVQAEQLPPDQVKADPNAAAFPGAVDPKAERVTRTLTLSTELPGWVSTGLYAAPGEEIELSVPAYAANAKLSLRIGCHSDENWHHDKWTRCPSISRQWPIKQMRLKATSPFGGLIYLEVPKKCAVESVKVTISGAVEAPYFVLGQTSVADWRTKLRKHPAPWAELQANNVTITVPSKVIRVLDDPEPVLKLWDRIIATDAELGPRPLDIMRPERYVADEQISAGYMHSGYPIMTHLDAAESLVSYDKLAKGQGASWGLYHEMGHNHQHGDWTFDGTGEVTVNLFTLYIFENVCGVKNAGHDALKYGPARQKLLRDYLATGPDFNKWKSDPFLALHMYIQLKEEFGWETFQRVFAEYRGLAKNERPKNDQEKRDQWLVRFSKATGKNLGPFFDAWGVPVTDAAKRQVADLPTWMPAELKGK